MTETVRERINSYLEDAIAAERNFETSLHAFGHTGNQTNVRALLDAAGSKARTQHERLTALLESRGGKPSEARTALAKLLAVTPLSAQAGHQPEEKNTQHLIVTFGAAGAERAMYEALAEAADEAGEQEVVALARQLQTEEENDAKQVWPLLERSAVDAFRAGVAAGGQPMSIIGRYMQDAIAAEKSFESQLTVFAKEGNYEQAQTVFAEHSAETRRQRERLTHRLEQLGGSPSAVKGLLAQFFAFAPRAAQVGSDDRERVTQNLIMGFAVESSETAMYEVFAAVARVAEDSQTEQLVRNIQREERAAGEKVWKLIGPAARRSILALKQWKAA